MQSIAAAVDVLPHELVVDDVQGPALRPAAGIAEPDFVAVGFMQVGCARAIQRQAEIELPTALAAPDHEEVLIAETEHQVRVVAGAQQFEDDFGPAEQYRARSLRTRIEY